MYILFGINHKNELLYSKIEYPFTPKQGMNGLYTTKIKSRSYLYEKAYEQMNSIFMNSEMKIHLREYFNCQEGTSQNELVKNVVDAFGDTLIEKLRLKVRADDKTYYVDEDNFQHVRDSRSTNLKKTNDVELLKTIRDMENFYKKNNYYEVDSLLRFKKIHEEYRERNVERAFIEEMIIKERLRGCLSSLV